MSYSRTYEPDRDPRTGVPFCNECCAGSIDAPALTRVVYGPHPITAQVVIRWLCRDCLAAGSDAAPRREGEGR